VCLTEAELARTLAADDVIPRAVETHVDFCVRCQSVLDRLTEAPGVRDALASDALARVSGMDDGRPEHVAVPGVRVLERLAVGSQGAVYRGSRTATGEPCAVKVLFRAGGLHLKRLEREVWIAEQLSHPCIAACLGGPIEAKTDLGPRPCVLYEYVSGMPIGAYCRRRLRRSIDIVRLFARVAEGVAYAHLFRVIHRDLKPSNILVTDAGTPKIVDFGLSRRVRSVGSSVSESSTGTVEGAVVGTVAYMSPEQAAGDALRVDTRSDVYALGVVLFELLSRGRLPHDRPRRRLRSCSVFEALRIVQDEAPAPLREHAAMPLPAGVEHIVAKALSRDPDDRYETARQMAHDLRAVCAGKAPPLAQRAHDAKRGRGLPKRWVVRALVALAVAAMLAAWVLAVRLVDAVASLTVL